MNPDEIKWAVLQITLSEMRAQLERTLHAIQQPMWGYQWRNDKDYQRFMSKVMEPMKGDIQS